MPQEGCLWRGENFWLRLTTASMQCFNLSEHFFVFSVVGLLLSVLNRCNDKTIVSARISLLCLAHKPYCAVSCVLWHSWANENDDDDDDDDGWLSQNAELASQTTPGKRKLEPVPSSYHKKYEHLLGREAAKDAAHTTDANKSYGFGTKRQYIVRSALVDCAPCGLRGCKNGPAPFPGRMSYKATKPGLVCLSYLSMLYYCIVVY